MLDEPLHEARLRQLTLVELRDYRRQLREEESRVSYWRRLVQARLDMAAAGRLLGKTLTKRQLVTALGDTVRRHDRLAVMALHAGDELPELPELARLWATPLAPGGGEQDAATVTALADAEASLSDYRATLHRLLDAATRELVRRYQTDPTACLDLLPTAPHRSAAAG